MEINRINVLISLLQYAGGIQGRTRLQKLVFLLQKEHGISLGYEFRPYNWGPLSFELQNDLNWLVAQGIVTECITEFSETGGRRYDYLLSEWGKDYFHRVIEPSISKEVKDAILALIRKWGSESIQKLLDYVHQKYPEYCLPPAHSVLE